MIPKRKVITSRPRVVSDLLPVLAGLLVCCLLTGCATTPTPEAADKVEPEITWPNPPDPPRIRFVKALDGPEDLGIKKSFFKRVVEFFTGPEDEGFAKPYGVTVDSAGRIYVADSGDSSYHMMDPADGRYERIDKFKEEKLRSPIGIAVDRNANVYVSDSELKAVYCFDKNGKGIRTIGDKELSRPAGLFLDEKNNDLYVVDTANHKVLVYDLQGNLKSSFGERGHDDGQLNFPTNIWIDKDGTILVCDSMNFRVQLFDRTGKFIGKIGKEGNSIGTFSKPKGVAVDTEGHVYVVEALFDAVQIFDRSGQVLLSFGSSGRDRGQFWLPAGIWIDGTDKIYVVDSYNQRIQIFQYIKRG